ncbi:hypothetical protein Lalb_Chr21g0315621 [Lupinus albus]|uniref:Uncharacterized protein n=1 Tax=Lupinus albus TaxID=3870 RepID=A0A6A4NU75_LUPAL|nr:hypothetical protein Lalb_Chr21g0315621 [Lupinus albus]
MHACIYNPSCDVFTISLFFSCDACLHLQSPLFMMTNKCWICLMTINLFCNLPC